MIAVYENNCDIANEKHADRLIGVIDEAKKKRLALIIENQRLFDEICVNRGVLPGESCFEMVYSIFTKCLIWDWISVQPLAGPAGLCWSMVKRADGDVHLESFNILAHTRMLKEVCNGESDFSVTADKITAEIEKEVLTDLRNNVGTAETVDLSEYTVDCHVRLSEALETLIVKVLDKMPKIENAKPDWIVIDSNLYERYTFAFDEFAQKHKLSLYSHKGCEGVLIGYKGSREFASPYIYAPYIPISLSAINEQNNSFRILTRYGKKLMSQGSRYYGKLTVIDEEK